MGDTALDELRIKTEEGDLNTILKATVGGYTKKSVLDYLAYLKKQQQDTKDASGEELRRLQSEKEALQKERDELEADLNEALTRITADEEELETCRRALETAKKETADAIRSAEEASRKAEHSLSLLDDANHRNEELNLVISDLEVSVPLPAAPSPDEFSMPSEEKTAEAESRMQALFEYAEEMRREMTARTEAMSERIRDLDTLTRVQFEENRETFENMRKALQSHKDQNELLECEKEELSEKVTEMLEKNDLLGRENTRLKAANLILQRRLEGKG